MIRKLSHPHIVPLIDSGESDGSLYYVSPYVAGGSLRDRLNRDRKLPIDDAVRIAHEVGTALDYAHRNGFVHRDVKPENILFADDHALLADFGIAHVVSSSTDAPITLGGFALGTPEYMSPEQASGETDIGVPGDVYGLACVFYEMVAGEPPFRGATPRATMAKQVTESECCAKHWTWRVPERRTRRRHSLTHWLAQATNPSRFRCAMSCSKNESMITFRRSSWRRSALAR